jgi:hypothetical protein
MTQADMYPLSGGKFWGLDQTVDGKYAVTANSAQGIYIYDITDINKLVMIQIIPVLYKSLSLKISQDEKYIIYLHNNGLSVYERIKEGSQMEIFPSIFNQHKGYRTAVSSQPWRSLLSFDEKTLWIAYGDYGFMGFDTSSPPVMDERWYINPQNSAKVTDVDGLLQDEYNPDILFLSHGRLGLYVWNMSDVDNPAIISITTYEGDCDDITRLEKELLVMGCGTSGIHIVNISNYSAPFRVG